MKRITSTATAAAAVALALALAPAAHAASVTNPADNPVEVSVKGDDGKTYADGLDTLPGYDDYECTYIPGAWFDFENNKVHYADGQTVTWTEWDRATGYKAWLANQNKSGGSSSSSGSSSTKTTKPTPAKTTKASTTSGSTSGSSSSSDSSSKSKTAAVAGGAAASTAGATPGATSTAAAPQGTEAAASPGATTGATGQPVSTDPASVAPGVTGDVADTALASTSSEGRGTAGILILVGLAAAGALIFAGRSVFGRFARKGSAS